MAGTRLDTTDHAHFDSRSPLPREPGRLLDTTPQGRDRALDRGTTGARRPARKKSLWGRRARWALRGALLGAVLLACVKLPRTARADHELWLWSEMRIPVATAEEFPVRTTFRLFNDTRFSGRRDGLHQVFLRFGPMFEVTPWLLLALNATVYADHLASGAFDEERRAELEPTVHWRWGDLAFTDRNRLEYRWRDTGDAVRYRNQLRVSYAPPERRIFPFVWNEALILLNEEGFNQNRLTAGLTAALSPTTRLEAGYMFRSREELGTWFHDHIGVLYLFYDGWGR